MRKVLVTGGSGGIGREIVRVFLENNDRVIFIYNHSAEKARFLMKEGAVGYSCELSSPEAIRETFRKIKEEEGGIDVLVNNAGVALFSLLHDTTDEMWQRVRSVNYDAPFYVIREVLPWMIKRKDGRIINISSMWGQVGASCECAYSAAKAGLIGLTKALAKEVGPSGITVNCICPGVIDTEMNAGLSEETIRELRMETPLERIGKPEEVAALCLYLASGGASFVTGQVIGINGGFVIT